jgi:hypothetical protein
MAAAVVHDAEPLRTVAEVRDYRDAALIAAAPDLLTAVEVLLLWVEMDDSPRAASLCEMARAALAKVEGK